MAKPSHPANTISDHDFQVFSNQRARALEKMPPEDFNRHCTTHRQVEAAKRGRN